MTIALPVWVLCVIIMILGLWVMSLMFKHDGPAGCVPIIIGFLILAAGVTWLAID